MYERLIGPILAIRKLLLRNTYKDLCQLKVSRVFTRREKSFPILDDNTASRLYALRYSIVKDRNADLTVGN